MEIHFYHVKSNQ